MELRAYGNILWRRIWIVALVFGIVALYVGYQYYTMHKASAAKTYHSLVTLRIGLQTTGHSNNQNYTDYVNTSEVLTDEFVTGPTLTANDFGTQVAQQIQTDMPTITQQYGAKPELGSVQDAAAIVAALTPVKVHSVVSITVNWNTEPGSWAIARAVGEVIETNIHSYLNYKASDTTPPSASSEAGYPLAAARVINESAKPTPIANTSSSKTTLLLALLVVGLIIGIALAFLVEYLDDRIHSAEEIPHLLQLPVFGEVPRVPPAGRTKSHSASSV